MITFWRQYMINKQQFQSKKPRQAMCDRSEYLYIHVCGHCWIMVYHLHKYINIWLQVIHPCYLWLADDFVKNNYLEIWFNKVKDNCNCNKHSYSWFKMNCFMSVTFNCARYMHSQYQQRIAIEAVKVCDLRTYMYNHVTLILIIILCIYFLIFIILFTLAS